MLKNSLEKITYNLRISWSLALSVFKLRNSRNILGIFWYLLDPIILFIIFLNLKSFIIEGSFIEYPLYLFVGLVCFDLYRRISSSATSVMLNNKSIIKSINVPKEPFVISKVIDSVLIHVFEVLIILALVIYFDLSVFNIFGYLVILILFLIFNLGLSFVLAVLGAYINDMKNIISVLNRVLWFATPIFYVLPKGITTSQLFGSSLNFLQIINFFNPIYYFIEAFRLSILEGIFPNSIHLGILVIISIASLLIGLIIFNLNKENLSERVN